MLTVEKKKKYTADYYMMLEKGAPFQILPKKEKRKLYKSVNLVLS